MARRLSYSARFPFPADVFYNAYSTKEYWTEKMTDFRNLTPLSELSEFDVDDEGITVVQKQNLPHEYLPPIAQGVVKKDMIITREEFYGAWDGESSIGDYKASIPAGPGSLKGEASLFNTETGCTMRYTTVVKVFVPFVGTKLEQLILINLVDLFRAEAEYLKYWVDKND
ncbi:DUF2505 domain-containing protein [Tsukamurella tyrosinosolvens]|jgi:hypothetical protein|uniref:DUF2505 domain-containing protein n=1 Tax=Tsukamurella tyrosinosolvens TaxID=57704 RepID=A0A1H5AFK9_TSUTY|nr:DUF2505 domain-containing protein [Tsukamurella tyrosinosolvens]AUN42153.1 hypothetical protein ASU32_20830 [Tsukamurella tyrosinosolvens]KXO95361.1 hypothetical protein AXK58_11635 [Tsukamurella tyrosinosolvens]KXP07418.1 hypothetical protein AXK59_04910 [Tsukamurella tyrosinosolvens]KZL98619.1 hypothetical protein AXX05_07060 [Tsukamurella tyrosinosolvens]MCA4994824.1 DUF2505 domain-containing protein [Tsukamurella tyrosinosolvens]